MGLKEAILRYADGKVDVIYPLALKTEKGLQQIERVINTAGYNYWLT